MRITEQRQRLPRAVVESLSCQKFSGYGPGQLSLDMHAWAGALDQITSRGLFQPQPVSDFFDSVFSVILQNDLLLIKKGLNVQILLYQSAQVQGNPHCPWQMLSSKYFHYSFCCNSWCDIIELINLSIVSFLFLIPLSFTLLNHHLVFLFLQKMSCKRKKNVKLQVVNDMLVISSSPDSVYIWFNFKLHCLE